MANAEQVKILKQGVKAWNKWRKEHSDVEINLEKANLEGADLRKADLTDVEFFRANLCGANLSGADLSRAWCDAVDLRSADLSHANLFGTILGGANLREADLRGADLGWAMFLLADLTGAKLDAADLKEAYFHSTIVGGIDLSKARGLKRVRHASASTVGTDTIRLSRGKIPEGFLRGCGLSDWEIESTKLYNPDLSNEDVTKTLHRMYDLRASQAFQISPLFISYSHAEGDFVDKLEIKLNEKGVRYWRDIHDAKAGRLEKQIDRAIELNPTLLLILSQHSLQSDWVELEVRKARQLEKKLKRDVLYPVAVDNSWKKKNNAWPKRLMEQITEYNILDFSAWKDDSKFEDMYRKLIDGLDLFYK